MRGTIVIVSINIRIAPTPTINPNSCTILIFVNSREKNPTAVVKLVRKRADPISLITPSIAFNFPHL